MKPHVLILGIPLSVVLFVITLVVLYAIFYPVEDLPRWILGRLIVAGLFLMIFHFFAGFGFGYIFKKLGVL